MDSQMSIVYSIDMNNTGYNVAILVVKELCPNLSTDLGSSNMAEFFQESMTYQI